MGLVVQFSLSVEVVSATYRPNPRIGLHEFATSRVVLDDFHVRRSDNRPM